MESKFISRKQSTSLSSKFLMGRRTLTLFNAPLVGVGYAKKKLKTLVNMFWPNFLGKGFFIGLICLKISTFNFRRRMPVQKHTNSLKLH
jgi:hypothetical protein